MHSTDRAIAISARDHTCAAAHAPLMERWFRATGNPVLIAQTERMLRRVRALLGAPPEDVRRAGGDAARSGDTARWQTALAELTLLREDHDRAEQALHLALQHARPRRILVQRARPARSDRTTPRRRAA